MVTMIFVSEKEQINFQQKLLIFANIPNIKFKNIKSITIQIQKIKDETSETLQLEDSPPANSS